MMPAVKKAVSPNKKSLRNFFTTVPKEVEANGNLSIKRKQLEIEFENESDSIKKIKTDEEPTKESPTPASPSSFPLTPEQHKLVGHKQTIAKIRKQSNSLQVLDCELGPTWFPALEAEFKKEYFMQLNNFVLSERNRATIYPPPENVWEWTKQCKIEDVKVVILGQDPYHGPRQAHGLCFSVQKGVSPPPSLVNIYKELTSDIEGFKSPGHGHLVGWAQQGVLLLNAVLTVESAKPNSHKDRGWEKITDAVISWISKNLNSVVFLLWGAQAQKKAAIVDKRRHHLLQAVHPSPLSAHRGFLGCKHFSKCNELLVQSGKSPIDWKYLPYN